MYGYRAVELVYTWENGIQVCTEYGIELDANIVMRGLDTWEDAENLADQLNKAYQAAFDRIKAS